MYFCSVELRNPGLRDEGWKLPDQQRGWDRPCRTALHPGATSSFLIPSWNLWGLSQRWLCVLVHESHTHISSTSLLLSCPLFYPLLSLSAQKPRSHLRVDYHPGWVFLCSAQGCRSRLFNAVCRFSASCSVVSKNVYSNRAASCFLSKLHRPRQSSLLNVSFIKAPSYVLPWIYRFFQGKAWSLRA